VHAGAGAWQREILLSGGTPGNGWPDPASAGTSRIMERGLLCDITSALVVQWLWEGWSGVDNRSATGSVSSTDELPGVAGTVTARVIWSPGTGTVPAGAPSEGLPLELSPGVPASVCIAPSGADLNRLSRLLRPLEARERQRTTNRSGDRPATSVRVEPDRKMQSHSFRTMGQTLADAPLAHPVDSEPSAPFLAGTARGGPVFLGGSSLAEVGLGALAVGHTALALASLRSLAGEVSPPPVPLLHLAADWILWTGEWIPVAELRPHLDRAAGELGRQGSRYVAPAGHPDAGPLLRKLVQALEPAGLADWTALLDDLARAVEGGASSRQLPVLGRDQEPPRAAARAESLLPAPESFEREPGSAMPHLRTLLSARLVRSWVEGVFGARPDASYGRVRLSPSIGPSLNRLRLQNLKVGDSMLTVDCRRSGTDFTFELRQSEGRTPLNVVFEPLVPLQGIDSVRIGGEVATVDQTAEGSGIRLRCQFPLDPSRILTVAGST
jgi:hypothetical protein